MGNYTFKYVEYFTINESGQFILLKLKHSSIGEPVMAEVSESLHELFGKYMPKGNYMEYTKIHFDKNDERITAHKKYISNSVVEQDNCVEDPLWWGLATSEEIWADKTFNDFLSSIALEYTDIIHNGFPLEVVSEIKQAWKNFCDNI